MLPSLETSYPCLVCRNYGNKREFPPFHPLTELPLMHQLLRRVAAKSSKCHLCEAFATSAATGATWLPARGVSVCLWRWRWLRGGVIPVEMNMCHNWALLDVGERRGGVSQIGFAFSQPIQATGAVVCVYSPRLLHCDPLTHTHADTHTHTSLSLPVSYVAEWSRCWGPIVAQCHFLVLPISALCCRWLSFKGSTHTHAGTEAELLPVDTPKLSPPAGSTVEAEMLVICLISLSASACVCDRAVGDAE